MANFCKYYKEVKQVSYDSGQTWENLDVYRVGELYESDAPDCGGGTTQYKWVNVSGEYTCVGTTKYQKTKKQQSTDGGNTWTDVSPIEYGTGTVIEYNSSDCIASNVKFSATYRNGNQYEKECDNTSLYVYDIKPNGYDFTAMTSAVIGECVTEITQGAFGVDGSEMSKMSLTSVTIPNTVTRIGWSAFYQCSSLKSVNIPSGITEIEMYTFDSCYGLTSISIPTNVTVIGDGAFEYCKGLTSVTISSGVTSIGEYAFYNCYGLRSVTILATTPPSVGENAFYNHLSNNNNYPIYVPAQSVNAYKSASGWSVYSSRIQAIS